MRSGPDAFTKGSTSRAHGPCKSSRDEKTLVSVLNIKSPSPSRSLPRLNRFEHSTVSGPTTLHSTTASTKKAKDVTTVTVVTTAVTTHTTTTTITTLPLSCHTNGTSSTASPTSSTTTCPSATPNPNPAANDTCAEDGLLEYSSTPLQPPLTLEGCAVACLADADCLSFTFIPSESGCSTSLYPLADSANAGTQDYHIYNYDRDCYSCSL